MSPTRCEQALATAETDDFPERPPRFLLRKERVKPARRAQKCARDGCDVTFLATRPERIYCSRRCNLLAFRERERERAVADAIAYERWTRTWWVE